MLLFYGARLFQYDRVTGEPADAYWYAQTLYLTGQYNRAAHLLKANNIDTVGLLTCYPFIKKLHIIYI